MDLILPQPPAVIPFDRHFFTGKEKFTAIGRGSLGGKAHGLALMRDILESRLAPSFRPDIEISIPTLTVITTEFFDLFMEENDLREAGLLRAFGTISSPARSRKRTSRPSSSATSGP